MIFTAEQCAELFGSIPQLAFSVGTRTWTSSYSTWARPPWVAMSLGFDGGADGMYSIGEPSTLSKTMGSQRPALAYQNQKF